MYGLHGKTLKATIRRNARIIEVQKRVLSFTQHVESTIAFIAKLSKENALLTEAVKLNKNDRYDYLKANGYYNSEETV
jgi:hypothetical protein